MEDLDSTLLDDEVYPFHLMDGLPEPRQHQVDQGIQGDMFRTVSTQGKAISMFGKLLLDESTYFLDTSGGFRANQWTGTEEQKTFLGDWLQASPRVMDWA